MDRSNRAQARSAGGGTAAMPTPPAAVPASSSPARVTDEPKPASDRLPAPVGHPVRQRQKDQYAAIFWIGMIVSTVIHFAAFQFWPTVTAEDFSYTANELEAMELPPEIEIPPPPEQIARPATPVVSAAAIDEDITIAPTTFEDNPVEDLPPPPEDSPGMRDPTAAPAFTPYTVAPKLENRDEAARAITREYPPMLRDARIGGQVLLWFYIDTQGRVVDTRVAQSSGYRELDNAAARVAEILRFTPAQNRDQVVPVWVQLPIMFQVR